MNRQLESKLSKLAVAPTKNSDKYKEWLNHNEFLSFLNDNINENEIVIYSDLPNAYFFSALINVSEIENVKPEKLLGWGFHSDSGWGICEVNVGDRVFETRICPPQCIYAFGVKGLEEAKPIYFDRYFEGLNSQEKSYFEINQEITQSHDLHYVPERQAYCKLDDAGDIVELIKFRKLPFAELGDSSTIITIDRKLLNQHLSVSGLSLIRLFESNKYPHPFNEHYSKDSKQLFDKKNHLYYEVHDSDSGNASRLRGLHIYSCSEPYDNDDYKYETFTAHDIKHGKIGEFSCDPKQLDSYFTDTGKPLEITPAFFKPEVLLKYKNNPDKYKIQGRSISCRGAWGLRTFDINEEGQVHTYLIYLGNLPYSEQVYWKAYNEEPKGSISDRALQTDILGCFDRNYDPLESLKATLSQLIASNISWWRLIEKDGLSKLHVPVTDSSSEWASDILELNKVIVDGFEKRKLVFIAKSLNCPIEKDWGSLKIIESILIANDMEARVARSIMAPLSELQALRSKAKAHANSESNKIKQELINKYKSFKNHYLSLIKGCNNSIEKIAEVFETYSLDKDTKQVASN